MLELRDGDAFLLPVIFSLNSALRQDGMITTKHMLFCISYIYNTIYRSVVLVEVCQSLKKGVCG